MLEHAKRVAGGGRHLGWPRRTFEQNQGRYAYYMKKIGISGRDSDCVGHGLRAEFAENMALLMGLVPATLGGTTAQMGKVEREAIQMKVSEAMGHHRINVTGAYYGGFRARPVLARKSETYITYKDFTAQVRMDLQAGALRGVIAGKSEDVEFSATTIDKLHAEFHRVVDQIIADVMEQEYGRVRLSDDATMDKRDW
jgi:hypothetical protein